MYLGPLCSVSFFGLRMISALFISDRIKFLKNYTIHGCSELRY